MVRYRKIILKSLDRKEITCYYGRDRLGDPQEKTLKHICLNSKISLLDKILGVKRSLLHFQVVAKHMIKDREIQRLPSGKLRIRNTKLLSKIK
jgi:hypothetical protein